MENNVKEISQLAINGLSLANTNIPAVMCHHEFSIKSLEEFQARPARIRQQLSVSSAQSLIDYVNKFKIAGTVIFSNLDKLTIKAIFDYHVQADQPRWGDHVVSYTCPHSKDWKAWTGKDKTAMNQIEFGHFLENQIHCVASENEVSGAELLAMVLAFEETRQSEFKSVQRLQDGTMAFNYTNEKTGGGKARLPEEITLGIQPFHNGDYYKIKARIRYRIKDGELKLWYELINPEKVIEDAFNTTLETLKQQIAEVDFYEGTVC